MNWKDYFYFQKRDRTAIILLLILIVISGGVYLSTRRNLPQQSDKEEAEATIIHQEELISKEPEEEPRETTTKNPEYIRQEKLKAGETIELNSADTTQLKKIPGIGSAFSNRIIKYGNLLGGYYSVSQLKEVYGIDEELYQAIKPYFTIDPRIKIISVNSADFNKLNRHPYISYEQTKIILDLRKRKGKIESIDRLSLLDEFTENDLNRLAPYLSFE